jgi:hypothetical protein
MCSRNPVVVLGQMCTKMDKMVVGVPNADVLVASRLMWYVSV